MGGDRRLAVLGAFAVVYVVWGSTYLAIRLGLETLPPFLMAGVRFVIAGSLMAGWAVARGAGRPGWRHWRSAGITGVLLLAVGNGGVTWAEQSIPSGLTALLVASEPLWLVLVAWGWYGGLRPGVRTAAGLALGLASVGMLIRTGGGAEGGALVATGATGGMLVGSLAVLVSCVAWAFGSLSLRDAERPDSGVLFTGMQMLVGGIVLVGLGLVCGEAHRVDLEAVTSTSVLSVVYLIVFGSILAYSAYTWLIDRVSPAMLSTYAYVNPVVAVLLGWAVAREPITPAAWVAMTVIVASVALVSTGENEAPAAEGELVVNAGGVEVEAV
jgi:drug/metabolite transporter (DMT)-like permease